MKSFWAKVSSFFRAVAQATTPPPTVPPIASVTIPTVQPQSAYHHALRPVTGNKGKPWISWATDFFPRLVTRGTYRNGWPSLIVVHYTAGATNSMSHWDLMKGAIKDGFTYLGIGVTGELLQGHPIDRWGYHAGESKWGKLTSLNDDAIGIEICSPGLLTPRGDKFYRWYDKSFTNPVPLEKRRYVSEAMYGCPTGWYYKFTPEQEATLIDTIRYIVENDPTGKITYDCVVGHHEISGRPAPGKPFRKSDPGGCLSMSMPEFRAYLKAIR